MPREDELLPTIDLADLPIGLTATFYCVREPPPIAAFVERWERFLETTRPQPGWFTETLSSRIRKLSPKHDGIPRSRFLPTLPAAMVSWLAYGGDDRDHPHMPMFHATFPTVAYDAVASVLFWGVPLGSFSQAPELARWFEHLAAGLPVLQATCGLGFAAEAALSQVTRTPTLRRYRGLDYDAGERREDAHRALRPPNWLTLLHPSFVERLGGREALSRLEQLGLGIVLRDLAEGLLIQAGPRPVLGDVNAGESVEAYRAVARALRPLRAVGPHTWLNQGGYEEADEWYARFD
jgi:hypothetical protein